MNRGVIASPMNIKPTLTGCEFSGGLSPETIRYYLLYWDKIIIPDNNLISYAVPEEKDLFESSVLYRPRIQLQGRFAGPEIGLAIIAEQCRLAEFFCKDPHTDWVIHQSESSQICLPSESTNYQNTLRFNFHRVLPVPDSSVHINEILEFKEFRKDELGDLHYKIDELYGDVLASPDQTLAGKTSVSKLVKSIDALDKVTKERFGFFRKFDIQVQYNIKGKDIVNYSGFSGLSGALLQSVPKLLSGQAFDLMSGYTIPLATVAGAVAGFATGFDVSIKKAQTPKTEGKHLTYLSNASELGLITI